jgi:hypothetical protein
VIRALLIARRSAVGERTRVLNQLQAVLATAPVALRERVGSGTGKQLERRIIAMRIPANSDSQARAIFGVMRDLTLRSRAVARDAQRYERKLAALVRSLEDAAR